MYYITKGMLVEMKNNVTSTCTAISASLYILPFILVGSFLSIFDQFVINVAAPAIISSLHPSALGWLSADALVTVSDGSVSTVSGFFFLP